MERIESTKIHNPISLTKNQNSEGGSELAQEAQLTKTGSPVRLRRVYKNSLILPAHYLARHIHSPLEQLVENTEKRWRKETTQLC